MPSFFIFDCSVVRLSPRISAALPGPVSRQPLFSRTPRMCRRLASSRLGFAGMQDTLHEGFRPWVSCVLRLPIGEIRLAHGLQSIRFYPTGLKKSRPTFLILKH
jgi:hypothetical protein